MTPSVRLFLLSIHARSFSVLSLSLSDTITLFATTRHIDRSLPFCSSSLPHHRYSIYRLGVKKPIGAYIDWCFVEGNQVTRESQGFVVLRKRASIWFYSGRFGSALRFYAVLRVAVSSFAVSATFPLYPLPRRLLSHPCVFDLSSALKRLIPFPVFQLCCVSVVASLSIFPAFSCLLFLFLYFLFNALTKNKKERRGGGWSGSCFSLLLWHLVSVRILRRSKKKPERNQ